MSFFAENSFWVFIILTILGGGGAGYMGGRSLALGWKPIWLLVGYMLILGAGVRFVHFALFQDTLTSLFYYVVQTAFVLAFSLLGYRVTRTNQMTKQYPWLYEKTGPLTWRQRN